MSQLDVKVILKRGGVHDIQRGGFHICLGGLVGRGRRLKSLSSWKEDAGKALA
jgi:hypothetical protein